jgi:hypothetical protein
MSRSLQPLVLLVILFFSGNDFAASKIRTSLWPCPQTKKSTLIDDYHGVKVADPYRWLEDSRDPEVKDWIEAQNKLTSSYLEKIPYRQAICARLQLLELADMLTWGVTDHEAGGQMDGLGAVFFHFRRDVFNIAARAAAAIGKADDFDGLVFGIGREGSGPFTQGPETLPAAATLIAFANDNADLLHESSNTNAIYALPTFLSILLDLGVNHQYQ